jgi:hypothetical protein
MPKAVTEGEVRVALGYRGCTLSAPSVTAFGGATSPWRGRNGNATSHFYANYPSAPGRPKASAYSVR